MLVTETSQEDFVIDFNKVEATVTRNKGGDLFGVLDQLHTHSLAHGRIRLFGFNTTNMD